VKLEAKIEEEDEHTFLQMCGDRANIPVYGSYAGPSQSLAPSNSGTLSLAAPNDGRRWSAYEMNPGFDHPLQLGNRCTEDHKPGVECTCNFLDAQSPYFPFPENCETSFFGIMKTTVGNPVIDPLLNLPIEPSRRNAELYHLCKLDVKCGETCADYKQS